MKKILLLVLTVSSASVLADADTIMTLDCKDIEARTAVNDAFTLMTAPALNACLEQRLKKEENLLKIELQKRKRNEIKGVSNRQQSANKAIGADPASQVVKPMSIPKKIKKMRIGILSLQGGGKSSYIATLFINNARHSVKKGAVVRGFKVLSITSKGVTLKKGGKKKLIDAQGVTEW